MNRIQKIGLIGMLPLLLLLLLSACLPQSFLGVQVKNINDSNVLIDKMEESCFIDGCNATLITDNEFKTKVLCECVEGRVMQTFVWKNHWYTTKSI